MCAELWFFISPQYSLIYQVQIKKASEQRALTESLFLQSRPAVYDRKCACKGKCTFCEVKNASFDF